MSISSQNPKRVLTISKPYVGKTYRKKLEDLAQFEDLEIGLVCPLAWGSQSFEGDIHPKVRTYRLPIAFNGKNHFHFYYGLEAAIKDFRPDLLNIEEEHYSLVTFQAMRIAKALGVKPMFYTWQNIHKQYLWPFSAMERFNLNHAVAAVGGNQESLAILRDKGFNGKMFHIPQMGVDLSSFKNTFIDEQEKRRRRRDLGLDPHAFWLSYFGRIVPEKGICLAIEALARISPEHPHVNLLIVGEGPNLTQLQNLAKNLNVSDRIKWISQIPSTDVYQWLSAMDTLVLPSLTTPRWKEQFGRILVEAMASTVVTVGSNSGEIPHVIGSNGLIFSEGQIEALAGAIKKLIQSPTYWHELAQTGHKKVSENYSDFAIAKKFRHAFLSILDI